MKLKWYRGSRCILTTYRFPPDSHAPVDKVLQKHFPEGRTDGHFLDLAEQKVQKMAENPRFGPFWVLFSQFFHVVLREKYLGFRSYMAYRYIRNALIFCDHCFLIIWTPYNGMPRNLGFVHYGMTLYAGE